MINFIGKYKLQSKSNLFYYIISRKKYILWLDI